MVKDKVSCNEADDCAVPSEGSSSGWPLMDFPSNRIVTVPLGAIPWLNDPTQVVAENGSFTVTSIGMNGRPTYV
jgi:hypothetical protein